MAKVVAINDLIVGDIVDFNIYGVGTINNVRSGTIIGFSSGKFLRNPNQAAVNHANIYSSIPNINTNVVPNNYTAYNYIMVQLVDDSIVEIGIPWVNPISLTRLVRQTVTVIINDFDSSQLEIIKDMLTTNGFLSYQLIIGDA